jgi:hypothetical protein
MIKKKHKKTQKNTNPTEKRGMNSGASEGYVLPDPHVTPVYLGI